MDKEFIKQYIPLYSEAALLTVKIGFLGIAAAVIIGLVCETVVYFKISVLRRIVSVYIELSRNTPLLIQLFFIYYGLPKIGIRTDAQMCGIAGLAFLGGSYMAEAFRSGVEAVDVIQEESLSLPTGRGLVSSMGNGSRRISRGVILCVEWICRLIRSIVVSGSMKSVTVLPSRPPLDCLANGNAPQSRPPLRS